MLVLKQGFERQAWFLAYAVILRNPRVHSTPLSYMEEMWVAAVVLASTQGPPGYTGTAEQS